MANVNVFRVMFFRYLLGHVINMTINRDQNSLLLERRQCFDVLNFSMFTTRYVVS